MTKEQKLYKSLIKADLKIVWEHYNDQDKSLRLQAAYHMQQAVEKTIKLNAGIEGLNLWGHEIDSLIKQCDDREIEIFIPQLIRDKADLISHREAECRYFPITIVRKDSIKRVYDITIGWLESGSTKR